MEWHMRKLLMAIGAAAVVAVTFACRPEDGYPLGDERAATMLASKVDHP